MLRAPTIHPSERKLTVITLGVILLILGLLLDVGILWTIGIVMLVIGAVLFILGTLGRTIGPRAHYW